MSIEALVFDVDGTLADTEEQHRLAFNGAFEAIGMKWRWDRAEYRALLRVPGGKERLAAFFRQQGDEAALLRIAELHADKSRRYAAAVESGAVALRPGVASLLAEARARGLKLAIATTTSAPNITALLSATLGARGAAAFDVIACGDEVARKKPSPDVYELALKRLGVAPARAVAFEDSEPGVRAAVAAGLFTVVTPSFWSEGDDFTGAAVVRESLEGVTLEDLSQLFGRA